MSEFRRKAPLLLLMLVLVVCLWPAGALAQSGAGISVSQNQAVAHFAQDVQFSLKASSGSAIREVILFYRISGSGVTTRAYPDIRPAQTVSAAYTWELEAGQLAPGTEITYYWEISDNAGGQLRTEARSLAYNDDRFQWQEFSAGQVRLFYYQGKRPDDLMQAAQAAIQKQGQQIGVVLEKPIRIYVYASRNDMRLAIPSRSSRYDEMTTTLGIVMAEDTLLLLGSAAGVEKTLAHELTHLVVGLATKGPLSRLPRWLDEGLAMYAEGQLPAGNKSALDKAVRGDTLISVRSLSGYAGDPNLVDLFYGESYSLVAFLLDNYGSAKLLTLLNVFKRGAYQEDALQQVYGFGMDGLDAAWRTSLGLKPRVAGSAQPIPTRAATRQTGLPQFCGASVLPAALLGLAGVFRRNFAGGSNLR